MEPGREKTSDHHISPPCGGVVQKIGRSWCVEDTKIYVKEM